MQYKKVPKELISNWFKEKMNFSLNNEQLNDLCSQIDNQVKAINYTRCCTGEAEQLPKNNCTLNRQTCGKGSGCKYPHCHI